MYRIENLHVQNGNFEKADFVGASLINNKWENVNFAGADFSEAYIYEDDIRQVRYIASAADLPHSCEAGAEGHSCSVVRFV